MTDHAPSTPYGTVTLRLIAMEEDAKRSALPALQELGFQVHSVASIEELYRLLRNEHFDIVLLDVDKQHAHSMDIVGHLRSTMSIGIVMLTDPIGPALQARALREGVDVHLTKPVNPELLHASITSLSRRLMHSHHAVADKPLPARWCLDSLGWHLTSPSGESMTLTASEHSLMSTLVAHQGHTVMRETLIGSLTRNVHDFDPHRLEMIIHRLREKTFRKTGSKLPLMTVRGSGYLLHCDADVLSPFHYEA